MQPECEFLKSIKNNGLQKLFTVWYIIIRSYRQLNSGKFAALYELEEKLAYPCFTREWELLSSKKPDMKISRY